MIRRRTTSAFHRCLAVHMHFAECRDAPRRNRLPRTALAKAGHFIVGVALGAMVATVVLVWFAGG
jgi:hypothetical protein